ncbi:MAG TPA: pseudouridine synthase [Polyangiaceae bacterium]|nr:pseudouridine synthase [Polyangiaceae bacterium]
MFAAPELVYEDDWLVVANKPSGQLTHPGWARSERTTMSDVRDRLGQRVQPVHRLDRGTSGIIVLARDPATTAALSKAFQQGEVKKGYLALVRGTVAESGVIDHPVPRGEKGTERVPALTHFRRLGRSEHARCSLVAAEPRSGRLHQLRRHFKHLSHPIVGDVRYGDGRINREFRADWQLERLALHALWLELTHPVTGEALRFQAPLPEDLGGPLGRLGLLAGGVTPESLPGGGVCQP